MIGGLVLMSTKNVKDKRIIDTIRELCKELQKSESDLSKIAKLGEILSKIGLDKELYDKYEKEYDQAMDELVTKGREYMPLWF